MLRRGDSSASDCSSRGKSPRPISFPNAQHQPQAGWKNDLIKKFQDVSLHLDKGPKRHSMTDTETFDGAMAIGSSRQPVPFNNRQSTRKNERAMQKIRSDLNYLAAQDMNPMQQQYVRDLMTEMNVDQGTAEQAVRDTRSIEAARETISRLLAKKIQQDQMYRAEVAQRMSQNHYLNSSSQGSRHRVHYGSRESVNSLPQRGSPDGASSRAESPPLSGPNSIRHLGGNPPNYESTKNPKQLIYIDQNYNQYPRQYTVDNTLYEPRKMPTTSPPQYPGSVTTSNRNSGSFSPQSSDIGLQGSNFQVIKRKPIPQELPNYPNAHDSQCKFGEEAEDTGVTHGHVQQMIQLMSPGSPPGSLLASNGDKDMSSMKPVSVIPHQPIIKRNQAQKPPPSYTVAQQYKKIQSNQPSTSNSPGCPSIEPIYSDNSLANQLHTDSPNTAINNALMGNIQQHNFDADNSLYMSHGYPCSRHEEPPLIQRATYLSRNSGSPSSSTGPVQDQSDYLGQQHILQSNKNNNRKAVVNPSQNITSVLKHPQITPQDHNIETYAPIRTPNPIYQQPQTSYKHLSTSPVHPNKSDPPPYTGNVMSTGLKHPQQHPRSVKVDILAARKSNTGPRGGKPSPTNTVANVYLSAVENGGENRGGAILRHPKEKAVESAVRAARVTGNSNKRHSGSYSAAPCPKQMTISPTNNDTQEQPQFYKEELEEKSIRMSPVPVRRSFKRSLEKQRSENKMGSDSTSSEEEGNMEQVWETTVDQGLPVVSTRTRRMKKYSPEAFKFYMEQHMENVIKGYKARNIRRRQLEREMSIFQLPEETRAGLRQMLFQKESNYIRKKRAKMDLSMFEMIKSIGVGAFGKVMLARNKSSNKLNAIKFLKKKDVLRRNQVAHVKAERDILSEADNDWVVKLYYSFQDKENLYFVMDYIPGGDLMSLLIKKEIFEQTLARFYTAELTLALESVHKMGFIHRDIKPDNILIDRDGHIKLTDFGLCTGFRWTHDSKYYLKDGHTRQDSMDFSNEWSNVPMKTLDRRRIRDANRHVARSLVGTPNYIAPEVLLREGYTQMCDWWSVGVILYEMVVGSPPFHSDTPSETQLKVINYRKSLRIPAHAQLAPQTTDIILRLCCDQHDRIGSQGGAEAVKQHDFFAGINWENLRQIKAPFVPEIKFSEDTSNFDLPPGGDSIFTSGKDATMNNGTLKLGPGEHAFFEFTFRRFFDEDGRAQASAPRVCNEDPTIV